MQLQARLYVSPEHLKAVISSLDSELASLKTHVVGKDLPTEALIILGHAQGYVEFLRGLVAEAL